MTNEPGTGEQDPDLPRSDETGDADFAEEHADLSLADELLGGPEHALDQDSPAGLAGPDPDSV
jgi:hypothetical protein